MTAMDYLLAGAAGWSVLACAGGFSWSFVVTRLKRKAVEEAEVVNWLPFLPPVPLSDKHWLTVWPTFEDAEQAVYDRLFDDVAANFRVIDGAA